jgi:hypothetical protein
MQNPGGIDACELIVRLQAFALGDDPDAMSDAQIEAALGLLGKAVPDLIEITVRHEAGNAVAAVARALAPEIEK